MPGLFVNVFLWLTLLCALAAFVSWRMINVYRDKAAFADYDRQAGYERWVKILIGLAISFGLSAFLSLIVFGFQVFGPPGSFSFLPDRSWTEVPGNVGAATETPAMLGSPTVEPPAQTATPTTEPSATPTPRINAVIGNTGFQGVNVREEPGLSGAILSKLTNGTEVLLLDGSIEVDGYVWQQIEFGTGQPGWVAEDFLILVEDGEQR
jgi:hypothetical protein